MYSHTSSTLSLSFPPWSIFLSTRPLSCLSIAYLSRSRPPVSKPSSLSLSTISHLSLLCILYLAHQCSLPLISSRFAALASSYPISHSNSNPNCPSLFPLLYIPNPLSTSFPCSLLSALPPQGPFFFSFSFLFFSFHVPLLWAVTPLVLRTFAVFGVDSSHIPSASTFLRHHNFTLWLTLSKSTSDFGLSRPGTNVVFT